MSRYYTATKDLYSSPDIILVMKSGSICWAAQEARIVKGRGAYRVLWEKRDWKITHE
jgi:hypothetical protein